MFISWGQSKRLPSIADMKLGIIYQVNGIYFQSSVAWIEYCKGSDRLKTNA